MNDRLVTLLGGGGFLGRYVAQELLRAGARVRIAQRKPRDAFFLRPLGGVGQTQFIAADLTRPETIERACDGADAVLNLVGSWSNFDALHVQGAQTAAQAAARAGAAAFVQISAIGADPDSQSTYARSKAEGEHAVREAFPGATILRPTTVFGREDAFVNRFAGMIATLPVAPVLRPQAKFQPVYVADVAEAAARALFEPRHHGGRVYELGGPDVLTMAELLRWIAKAVGRDPAFVELPDALGSMLATFGSLPGAPITREQWKMLQRDAVVSPGAEGLEALGVSPTPLAAVAPNWLVRFRRYGRFGQAGEPA
ncbi:complex I NDUFA9 subunit family protein [Sphingosinithalassobacter sp. LHW66-3]|uniref:complex I NDUFA9 subunit family protein n=1 Tax=Sphingosinithalassobacter sp. LHW66-3 TaxID=3424718 RepID=UPI003D6A47A5